MTTTSTEASIEGQNTLVATAPQPLAAGIGCVASVRNAHAESR